MSRRRVFVAVLVTLVVLNGLLLWQRSRDDAVETARAKAESSVVAALPKLMSYTYADLADYQAQAKRLTTGDFKRELAALIKDQVLAKAGADQVTIRTTVAGAAVVEAFGGRVRLLVLVDQWRTTRETRTPTYTSSRLAVTVVERDGRWLISAVRPV